MIAHKLPNGHLLCINQTTHALLAASFCRHWGNSDFAPPVPYEPVMMAISQHDCGWYDWELTPGLCADGYPMDFLHGPTGLEKLALWQKGIDRVSAQHPYAGLIVGQHAANMHAESLPLIPESERPATLAFIARQESLIDFTRRHWQANTPCVQALNSPTFGAHVRLLQFGDTASLQITMPWAQERIFDHCPLDQCGDTVSIRMRYDDRTVTFDPWPYAVDCFEVSIHGKVLPSTLFPDEEAYHAALAEAPYHRLVWHVTR